MIKVTITQCGYETVLTETRWELINVDLKRAIAAINDLQLPPRVAGQ